MKTTDYISLFLYELFGDNSHLVYKWTFQYVELVTTRCLHHYDSLQLPLLSIIIIIIIISTNYNYKPVWSSRTNKSARIALLTIHDL